MPESRPSPHAFRHIAEGPEQPQHLTWPGTASICSDMQTRPQLDITLCAPRGFCAGVDRAIQIVELALKKYGAPVYVRHAIVHNKYVVDGLRDKGAVFVRSEERRVGKECRSRCSTEQ